MVRKIFFLAATTAVVSANAQNFEIDGHEAVDLGLSVLWATCNVGADSPEKPGDYFAWGEIEPKEIYSDDNYLANDWIQNLDADHDAATQKWGKNWRTPTKEEWEDLQSLEWELNTENTGFYVKGNEKSIFLPFTGNRNREALNFNKTDGYYWSSSYYYYQHIWNVNFNKDNNKMYSDEGHYGLCVRAVCEKSAVTKLNYVEKENANTVYKTIENGQIVIVKNGVKYNLRGQKL